VCTGEGGLGLGSLAYRWPKYTLTSFENYNQYARVWEFNLSELLNYSSPSSVFPSVVKNLKMRIYKTIILPVVLYGCETWSLTLREEHRQGV
jgi:hypothetical protein